MESSYVVFIVESAHESVSILLSDESRVVDHKANSVSVSCKEILIGNLLCFEVNVVPSKSSSNMMGFTVRI